MRCIQWALYLSLAAASGHVTAREAPDRREGVIDVDFAATPGADDSVFALFAHNAAPYQFGLRLMAHLRDSANRDVRVRHLLESNCSERQPICFETIERDVVVAVTFKDGRARFRVNEIASNADFIPGTAFDADGHALSAKRADYVGIDYDFPDGAASLTYRGFAEFMRARQVPLGPGGWFCVAINDANATMRCRLESTR